MQEKSLESAWLFGAVLYTVNKSFLVYNLLLDIVWAVDVMTNISYI